MRSVSVDSQKILDSLTAAVNKALEKKKRLGQYAVVWVDNKPVVLKEETLQRPENFEQLEEMK
jgi:hypothetical protein